MKLITYLNFKGNCQEAMSHYAQVLGGEVTAMFEFGDTPMDGGHPVAPAEQAKIMHASVTAGDQILMGSDRVNMPYNGVHGFAVSVQAADEAEAERIYDGLKDGADIQMTLGPSFFAKKFAMLKDRFGTPWMINCDGTAS